jgi:glycosyltransferase involved in cell wall biosynthesis
VKVLLVNKFYRPQGGAETVFFATERLLEEAGHEVVPFAMAHETNAVSEWSRFFVKERSYVDGPLVARVRDSFGAVYSLEARRALRSLLREFRPDVAHLHNVYHQLSLSVVDELGRAGIPIVMTLHDYKLVCPSYSLFTHDGVCERCVRGSVWNVVRHRCVKGSLGGSTIAAVETLMTRAFRSYERIDRFLAPSAFVRDLAIAGRADGKRIEIARYPVHADARVSVESAGRPRFAYVGRLVPEKGLDVLLTASARLRGKASVVLFGRGPLEPLLRRRIAAEQLPVELRGFVAGAVLRDELRRSTAAVLPSIAYENAPMALLESASVGVPAVASDLGGIPEMVEHGVTGLLFPAGEAEPLADALEHLAARPRDAAELGRNAWRRVQETNAPSTYLETLERCYAGVRADGGRRRRLRSR